MKKTILLLLCVLLLLSLYGCDKNDEPEWKKKVDMIEEGMPFKEVIEFMGGAGTDLHTNEPYAMYILSDEHILVICLTSGWVDNKVVDVVAVEPVVVTYEEFKEWFDYYPDDPEAPWNDPESPWNGDD
jgi:hypothetical protein